MNTTWGYKEQKPLKISSFCFNIHLFDSAYIGFTRNAPLVTRVESVSVKLKVPTQSGEVDVIVIVP